jgi:CheY-like chemotaxis protein
MSRKRIMIVDDEKAFTDMVKLNLEATGRYEVIIENKSEWAIPTAIKTMPDLILLDVIMPEPEGPDILNDIRRNETIKNIPIIFLTATVTSDEVKEHQGKIGGHLFLSKPTSLLDLMQSIEAELTKTVNGQQ